jgi:diketogulonate reductase-like aldo/keto reductase
MAQQAVLDALNLGYRHIDPTFIHTGEQTEKEVGNALQIAMSHFPSSAPIPRSEIFLATKQWRSYHGYDQTLKCLELSMKRLQVEYVDLYLIHWPGPAYNTMSRSRDIMENSPNRNFAFAKDGHESADNSLHNHCVVKYGVQWKIQLTMENVKQLVFLTLQSNI